MHRLSFQIIFLLLGINLFAQSPHGDNFDIDCSNCHVSENWKVDLKNVTFDHSQTKFNLVGQHQNVDCKSCHTSFIFSPTSTDCFSCHKDIHQGTVGFDCASCHTPTTWIVKDIVGLHQTRRFPLLGAHKLADCAQCHAGYTELKFNVLNVDCYACHSQEYASTQVPNHTAANFSTDCQECHNVSAYSWNTTNVNHSFFPLTGGHSLPSCFSCHQPDTFEGLSTECYSCHRPNYEATQNPNHIAAGLPTTCEVCHSINGWIPAQFDHNLTQFPLTGKHVNVDCADCHSSGYTGTPTECYSCHQQDYQNTRDPNHVTSQFPTDCSLCHTTAGWNDANFNHNITQFPLTGSHVQTACASCHTNGYTGTPTDCWSCHQSNYQSTTDPNHVTENYPQDCTLCHNTTNWNDANFDHNITQFQLTGAHASTNCQQCHSAGYTDTPTECFACHQTDYQQSTNPNHSSLALSTTCQTCHTTNPGWTPATFAVHDNFFQLLGAHLQINYCADCHQGGNYNNTPNTCMGCHSSNYNGTDDPPHQILNFSEDCLSCHTMNGWTPANFDHSFFPVSNRHNNVNCNECHSEPIYQPQCLSCHMNDFLEKHNTGDRTDCWNCHSARNWSIG